MNTIKVGGMWVLALFFFILLGNGRAAAQTVPKRGGTLVFVIPADPATLNPAITSGAVELQSACVMYQGLVTIDSDYNFIPMLAEAWDVSSDGKAYTFKLRKGVQWHDGRPFGAQDVKFSFEEVLAKYHPRSRVLFSKHVDSVETPDAHTVKVFLKKPYGPFLLQLICNAAPIIPRHIFQGTNILANPHNTKDIVGTGPFKFESWIPGDRITYVRNDSYWEAREPYLDRIIFKIIPDAAARVIAFERGEVDYLWYYVLPPQAYLRLKDNPKYQSVLGKSTPSDGMLTLNVQNSPLNNKLVRQALYTAIDREAIYKQVFFEMGGIAKSHITASLPWAYNPRVDLSRQYRFNLEKAGELLDRAGFPRGRDGRRFRPLRFVYEATRMGFPALSRIVQHNWSSIGVPVELIPAERQVMIDTVYVKRQFDVNVNQLTTGGDPAIGIERLYTCSNIVKRQFTNGAGYCNPKVDELFTAGANQPSNRQRAPYYHKLQEILADELPILPLYEQAFADIASKNFELKNTLWTGARTDDLWGKVYMK